eukprot:CAMPEP_0179031424 /NCGR_PEP_ID=MMETSP0796-20121207/11062_1 /TAXON_ID=73915 /ORGANISM="Pyrodinium bahamense, Strain pbaha01" /LENGTH=70 /DNA_ID=CAMNT_0020727613 /DNA_START=251 /DNA_END=462 /DNA_ORIENTATION=+
MKSPCNNADFELAEAAAISCVAPRREGQRPTTSIPIAARPVAATAAAAAAAATAPQQDGTADASASAASL